MSMLKLLVVSVFFMSLFACSQPSGSNNKHNSSVQSQTPSQNESKTTPQHTNSVRVMTPDWGIASELIAMGHPPIATGDNRMYKDWMGKSLPSTTTDIGIRYQPNPEMMAQLDIDLVIDNFFYAHLRSMYGDIPVKSLLFKSKSNQKLDGQRAVWKDYADMTLELGKMINQPEDAKAYITRSDKSLQELGHKFRQKHPQIRKLAVVQFSDVSNQRMYASNSVYQPALDKMGLELVTFNDGNDWGFISIQLGELDKLGRNKENKIDQDTCLIIVKPFSDMLQDELDNSALWHKMGFGKQATQGSNGRCMAIIRPVWMYGGISSMTSFADHMVHAKLYGGNIINSNNRHDHQQVNEAVNVQDKNTNNIKKTSEQFSQLTTEVVE